MRLLQLSAGQGPAECCLAVARALGRLEEEARQHGVALQLVEEEAGPLPGTLRSVLLELDGAAAAALAARWSGTLQWICSSPYRPRHTRKNWFIAGECFAPPEAPPEGSIRFEATRASGPGGQHVNKTSSAVRATHLASGLSVKVQSERSQHANRRLAAALIARQLAARAGQAEQARRAERRAQHHRLERGNATRVFRGAGFEPVAS